MASLRIKLTQGQHLSLPVETALSCMYWRRVSGLWLTPLGLAAAFAHQRKASWISTDRRNNRLYCAQYLFPSQSSAEDVLPQSQPIFPHVQRKMFLITNLTAFRLRQDVLSISLDSGLEAFSLSRAGASVAQLASQPNASPSIWTNCSSRTKLDCWEQSIISRIKLTCLATV